MRSSCALGVCVDEVALNTGRWWDTSVPNDGGVVNDDTQRAFFDKALAAAAALPSTLSSVGSPIARCLGRHRLKKRTLVVPNPAAVGPMCGMRVVQQIKPYRVARVVLTIDEHDAVHVLTTNIAALFFDASWDGENHTVSETFSIDRDQFSVAAVSNRHVCFRKGMWSACDLGTERTASTYGPMRQVLESTFTIVAGRGAEERDAAVCLANLMHMSGHAFAPVIDSDHADETLWNSAQNLVLVGLPDTNSWVRRVLAASVAHLQISETSDGNAGKKKTEIRVGACVFDGPGIGVAALLPTGPRPGRLALLLSATDVDGLRNVMSLATPTIPPMVRQPFSNTLPDVVVVDGRLRAEGAGGFLLAGYWNNDWSFASHVSYTSYCTTRDAPQNVKQEL